MPAELTETMIRAGASKESFARGKAYYKEGALYDTAISGNTLTAKCRGTYAPHYTVRVELDEEGPQDAACTCEYEYGGYCKHIVALLLAYMRDPTSFEQRPDPESLLREMDRDQMAALLKKLMQKHDAVRDEVERLLVHQAAKSAGRATAKGARRDKGVDVEPYRKRIRQIIREAGEEYDPDYEGENEHLAEELDGITQAVIECVETAQPKDALAIATAVLEEIRRSRDFVDCDLVEVEDFVFDLDLPVAEAVLSADLGAAEKQKLRKALEDHSYGFQAATDALTDGWNATGRGASTRATKDAEDVVDPDLMPDIMNRMPPKPDVVDAQLNVLNRRGEHDRFLSIALAAGRRLRYAQKLVDLDRARDAVQHATQHFTRADEALALAQQLHERNHGDDAVAVAERGLLLSQPRAELGKWLAPMATSRKNNDLARRAWVVVFDEDPSLALYQRIEKLAGERWNKVKAGLHKSLARSWHDDVYAEILLREQDWDAAIALAKRRGEHSDVQEIVADGVIHHRPDWVVELGKKRAQKLIDTVNSSHYSEAAEWLERVKKAYRALDQGSIWNAYLAKLKEDYKRRPSLQKELKRL